MGDLEVGPLQPKGVDGEAAGYSSPPSQPRNPNPSAIGASIWRQAEKSTQEIIRHIRPTMVSEQRRKVVVEYVQKLIRGFVSSEVFPFGSVPLKTYLPDGDIDLTAIGIPSSEDALASDVRSILEGEEHNKDSEFEVKDVQYIHAEVKLVKCLVQNIVVDISFNQIGGLCTLCFLEQVDRFIGKDHLFKRSIILIKAWCYYESRILGAHHGLISTYALETLVLYIFHLFYSSLDGPLAVLYRFLDYYSKFDWDKYCISLQGPVSLSSLPELSAETIDNDGGDLLLTEEFLRSCVDTFSVPLRGSEGNSRTFTKKHLNIIDPLRENNNLGRSVSKGNFYRIRSAFTYGARKLGRLLLLPAGSILDEVNLFFMNTMDRHGGGERPDVQDLVPRSLDSALVESIGGGERPDVQPVEKDEKEKTDKLSSESPTAKVYGDLNKDMKNIRISGFDECEERTAQKNTVSQKQQNNTSEVNGISSERLIGDAKDLATARASVLRNMTENPNTSASTKEDNVLDFRNAYHAPHLHLKLDEINSTKLGSSYNVLSTRSSSPNEEIMNAVQPDSYETDSSSSSTNLSNGHRSEGNPENRMNGPCLLNEMSDLSGDYEMHFTSLNYSVWCQEQIMSTYFLPMRRPPPYSYYHRGKNSWPRGSMFIPMNSNALSPRHPFSPTASYSMNPRFISSSYNPDDVLKPRGTGTYFPNMNNYHVHRERHSPGRAKNVVVPGNHFVRPHNNGLAVISQDIGLLVEKGCHAAVSQAQVVFSGNGGRGRLPQTTQPRPAALKAVPQPTANGIILYPPEFSRLEFGSLGSVSVEEAVSKEQQHGRKLDISICNGGGSGLTSPASSSQYRSPPIISNKGRALQSYQLKDEEDFPPLSG